MWILLIRIRIQHAVKTNNQDSCTEKMKNQIGKEKPNKKGKLLTTKAAARPKK